VNNGVVRTSLRATGHDVGLPACREWARQAGVRASSRRWGRDFGFGTERAFVGVVDATDFQFVAGINAFLGGTLDEPAMAGVVAPELYRNKS
jgi:hypothetical protein